MNYWENEKILLRAIEPDDREILFAISSDLISQKANNSIKFPESGKNMEKWLEENYILSPVEDSFSFIIENKNNEVAGIITTHHCDRKSGNFSYGASIHEKYRRRGYAIEAILMVLKYFFKELRYQKVTVDINSYNKNSIKLHEKLGFKQEGCIRRAIYNDGQYFDSLIYGLTIEEFNSIYK